jgi:hypothetical protein
MNVALQSLIILLHIWKVPGSNLILDTSLCNEAFRDLYQVLRKFLELVLKIGVDCLFTNRLQSSVH